MKCPLIPMCLLIVVTSACSKKESPTSPATCTYTVSSTSQSPAAGGGTIDIAVTKVSGSCTWSATSNASWATFGGAASGSDTGTLTLVVASNTSTSARSGTVTVTWNGG